MRKRLNSSLPNNSGVKFTRLGKPFIENLENKYTIGSNHFNYSNDSIINNNNNDFIDDIDDINEENIIEKIRRKPVSSNVEATITGIGFVFLMLLMIYVTCHDIFNLIK